MTEQGNTKSVQQLEVARKAGEALLESQAIGPANQSLTGELGIPQPESIKDKEQEPCSNGEEENSRGLPQVASHSHLNVINKILALDPSLKKAGKVIEKVGFSTTTWYGWNRQGFAPLHAWNALLGELSKMETAQRPHPLKHFTIEELKKRVTDFIEADMYEEARNAMELVEWCQDEILTHPRAVELAKAEPLKPAKSTPEN